MSDAPDREPGDHGAVRVTSEAVEAYGVVDQPDIFGAASLEVVGVALDDEPAHVTLRGRVAEATVRFSLPLDEAEAFGEELLATVAATEEADP